jgi:hypothetical protein
MIVTATVKSRAEEEDGYKLELEIPQFRSKFPTLVTRVPEKIARELSPGPVPYSIVLLRQNLKKDKQGTQPYDYYWGLEGLATAAETEARAKEPEPVDERRLQIAWSQAINCAVARLGVGPFDGAYLGTIEMSANLIYPLILKGPKQAQDVPQGAQGATPTAVVDDVELTRDGVIAWATTKGGYAGPKAMAEINGVTAYMQSGNFAGAVRLLKAAKE